MSKKVPLTEVSEIVFDFVGRQDSREYALGYVSSMLTRAIDMLPAKAQAELLESLKKKA